MKNLGYYNGKVGPLEEMSLPMMDRAVYFGDGVYEAACARNGMIYALEEHVDRMVSGARRVKLPSSAGDDPGKESPSAEVPGKGTP